MESREQLRVGIVGCGYQGRLLTRAIGRSHALRVTACADPDRDAAVGVATAAGQSNAYRSVDELLKADQVDAVVIATPHHLLRSTSLAAISAGKHVLAEKPIAVDAAQAAEIGDAVARAGIRYMAGYSLRFFVAQRLVYDLLRSRVAGDVQSVTAGIGMQPLSGWRARPETGGGQLLYLGSHLVDEILWFLGGEPVEVYAHVRYRPETGADETAAFQVRFAEGAVAQCFVTQAAEEWFDFVDIYGRDGRVSLRSSYWLQYQISVSSQIARAYSQPTTITPRLTDDPVMMMLVPEVEEFARAIRENREPAVTIGDARRVLEILDAVMESGRRGAPVAL